MISPMERWHTEFRPVSFVNRFQQMTMPPTGSAQNPISKPDRHITVEMEAESLARILMREDKKRFAICLSENGAYIGNIFYTDIRDGEAQLHIFIGEQRLCGKGRAYSAVCQILDYGFNTLKLEAVYALVKEENLAAKAIGRRAGFKRILTY